MEIKMEQNMRAVDIIIPVYNGYEDLQLCIPSVKKYTDLSRHRIILINDCSPDERVAPWLEAQKQDQVLVLHNEKNIGFSGNVNKGMAMSEDRDVILLNSDTIVTRGWVEKLQNCAYREEAIGTVTPLSNSATLCSVPVFCQDNPLPKQFTVDEYGELIERCSLRHYPEITVAVGFCMYIKREVIGAVGCFDAQTFGRGYGEENDFCNRAQQAGYHHVMCDDTFIYHKGTASFDTAEKQALLQAHEKILEERYPRQMQRNRQYCADNPDQDIRDNLLLYTRLHNGRKNLLYLVHLDFREGARCNMGGTQIHVKELTGVFRREYNVFVAARDGHLLCVTAYLEKEEIRLKFDIGEAPDFPVLHNALLKKIYEQILRAFSIDLVHIHHTQDLSLELYDAASALGIPIVTTLHDYYYACPTILLLDDAMRFCQGTQPDCAACLRQKKEIFANDAYLKRWRGAHGQALDKCKAVIFPSRSARDIMLEYYPQLQKKALVIPHGENLFTGAPQRQALPGKPEKSPKVFAKLDHLCSGRYGLNAVKGWVYLDGADNARTEVFVELTDKKGNADCFHVRKEARQDVADAFGTPDARMTGIDLRVSSGRLTDGPVSIRVIVQYGEYLYEAPQTFPGEYRRRFGAPGRLNVAFLGGMVRQKGSGFAKAMIPMEQKAINWFVLGELGDPDMQKIDQPNCYFSYKYRKEELHQLLVDNQIDIVCILPIWPETFCYTVSEAWMNGIPVLGTDIGAVGERIRSTGGGWLVPPNASPEEVLQELLRIKENPQEYQQKKQIVTQMPHKSVEAMCGQYRALYAKWIAESDRTQGADHVLTQKDGQDAGSSENGAFRAAPDSGTFDSGFIFQALAQGEPSVTGPSGAAQNNRLKSENEALKAYIDVLQGTTSYRLARKIADARIPFKEPLKRLLKKRHAQSGERKN